MPDQQDPSPPERTLPPNDFEGKSAAEWVGIGIGAANLAVTAYQTFKPDGSAQPPPEPQTPPSPTIELPPGVERE